MYETPACVRLTD